MRRACITGRGSRKQETIYRTQLEQEFLAQRRKVAMVKAMLPNFAALREHCHCCVFQSASAFKYKLSLNRVVILKIDALAQFRIVHLVFGCLCNVCR